MFLARAYRRLGELHEEAGHTREALQRYSDFVDMWKTADPSLQGGAPATVSDGHSGRSSQS